LNKEGPAVEKQLTFTQTLLRLVRKTLAEMANEDFRSPEASAALYEAARELGRRTPELVTRARDSVDWQKQVAHNERVSNGR
jgi:hypothetical protein